MRNLKWCLFAFVILTETILPTTAGFWDWILQFNNTSYPEPMRNNGNNDEREISVRPLLKDRLKDYMKKILHVENAEDSKVHLYGINIISSPAVKNTAKQLIVLIPRHKERPKKNDFSYRHKTPKTGNRNDDNENVITELKDLFHRANKKKKSFLASGLNIYNIDPKVLLKMVKRRSILRSGEPLGVPTRPEHLPEAMPIHPGHTLLRPAKGMLKSAVKYPMRDLGGAVYGNLDNVGITFGKTRNRIRYSDFRKANDNFLTKLQNSIQNSKKHGRNHPLIIIELDPTELKSIQEDLQYRSPEKQILTDDNGSEVLDDLDALFNNENKNPLDLRRKKVESKFRDRKQFYLRSKSNDKSKSEEEEENKDDSSDSQESQEKNPGNPFTIFKNKYKQNWMWNHKTDGLHVNINPFAPQLNKLGPTGAELFFARKWWYFNQDDYKPLGRKR